ncbi:RsmB/NOP family class I SAM-dependent RNA methyltransferase [Neobacillus mesonae]|nr:RsmB/NOP family class I SAM-dependent RNA methyltransferase [Neobacillus mesonae]
MSKDTLPKEFIAQMEAMLGQETEAFLKSYNQPRTQALRLNTIKLKEENKQDISGLFRLEPVPWCNIGFYYDGQERPGKHPYHTAGLYYIQEPSAMSAIEILDPKPYETVLDLAAAPGGKTTHMAVKMKDTGLLVSNEIHSGRAKILAENVERMGLTRTVVVNASPDELSARFPESFDRIMLDAPCSGEGMFRKDQDAVNEWSLSSVQMCVSRQWDILKEAYTMLKPGGYIAYSTCTFNRAENEETVERFILQFPDMEWLQTERIWPHRTKGEGHFVALLRKKKKDKLEPESSMSPHSKKVRKKGKQGAHASVEDAWDGFKSWSNDHLPGFKLAAGRPLLFGEALYFLPESNELTISDEQLKGLKMPRPGLHLGDWKKGRFEPAHALAMAAAPEQAARSYDLPVSSMELQAYLRGETLSLDTPLEGWTLVTTAGYPVGWAKANSGQLKNKRPKGLRLMS